MKELLISVRLVVLSLLVCCVLYPAVLLGFGQGLVPGRADGSLIRNDSGRIVGSAQIAQAFSSDRYFWPRPSAVDYAADAASGSNLSPSNPRIAERAREIIHRLDRDNGEAVPVDLVTTSGSGLDPHITFASAELQADRVARARDMSVARVMDLVRGAGEVPSFQVFGAEPVVNVLRLNLVLDREGSNGQE